MSLLQDVSFSLQAVLKEEKHSATTLHGQVTQREVPEKALASKQSEMWGSNDTSQLPRSLTDLT